MGLDAYGGSLLAGQSVIVHYRLKPLGCPVIVKSGNLKRISSLIAKLPFEPWNLSSACGHLRSENWKA